MDRAEQTQMARQHIFVVNGSPDFLNLLRDLLQEEHYNVTTTNFVPETFEQIAALNPALLIIDLVIGEQAGWDLLEHLAFEAKTREIPIIVVSTNVELLNRAEADPARYRADRLLHKPFDLDDLLSAIRELIGRA